MAGIGFISQAWGSATPHDGGVSQSPSTRWVFRLEGRTASVARCYAYAAGERSMDCCDRRRHKVPPPWTDFRKARLLPTKRMHGMNRHVFGKLLDETALRPPCSALPLFMLRRNPASKMTRGVCDVSSHGNHRVVPHGAVNAFRSSDRSLMMYGQFWRDAPRSASGYFFCKLVFPEKITGRISGSGRGEVRAQT